MGKHTPTTKLEFLHVYTYVGKCNRKGLQDYIQTDNSYAIKLRLEEAAQFILS